MDKQISVSTHIGNKDSVFFIPLACLLFEDQYSPNHKAVCMRNVCSFLDSVETRSLQVYVVIPITVLLVQVSVFLTGELINFEKLLRTHFRLNDYLKS